MKYYTSKTMAVIALAFSISACSSNGYADSAYSTTISYNETSKVEKVETSLGTVYATIEGMTLYIFTKDTNGVSNCYDNCAVSWPPFYAEKNAKAWGDFSIISRKDGTYQWTLKGQPLYTWVGDTQRGQVNGQGVGNVWYIATAE